MEGIVEFDQIFISSYICLNEQLFYIFLRSLQVCRDLVANVVHLL